jgi:hypothetical protein
VSPSVEIDDEVWGALQTRAEPLVDTPNSVLRRVLGLGGNGDHGPSDAPQRAVRAPVGSLLPESAYEIPILRALSERGGTAPARDVVQAVGRLVADQLTDLDRQKLPNGGERWQSRVQFSRLRLKQKGLIKSGSARGLWELAEAGAALLEQQGSP